jgi:hypothetical protein
MSAYSAKQMPPEPLVRSCRWQVFGFREIVVAQAPAQAPLRSRGLRLYRSGGSASAFGGRGQGLQTVPAPALPPAASVASGAPWREAMRTLSGYSLRTLHAATVAPRDGRLLGRDGARLTVRVAGEEGRQRPGVTRVS